MNFDIGLGVNMSKLYAKLAYRFGVDNINELLNEYSDNKEVFALKDDDELIDLYGDYYINKHTYNPENIKDSKELVELTVAILASQELQRRGMSIWNIKERYLYNHNIDINVVDVTYLDTYDDFDELNNLASWGHFEALYAVGSFYASPAGGDNKLCIKYWSTAANLGYIKCQETMAGLYLSESRGLKFDAEKIIYYYKCAARQGSSKAINFLQKYKIDIDSPVISQEEIERVNQIHLSSKNLKSNSDEGDNETKGGELLNIIFAILFWAFIIYEFVL